MGYSMTVNQYDIMSIQLYVNFSCIEELHKNIYIYIYLIDLEF